MLHNKPIWPSLMLILYSWQTFGCGKVYCTTPLSFLVSCKLSVVLFERIHFVTCWIFTPTPSSGTTPCQLSMRLPVRYICSYALYIGK
jgi:hypothetical protein